VSFDDLLVLPVRILREHPEVRERLATRFKHVLVDEYQDTNRAQYEFVRLIGGGHGNVAVVGDDDQAIYGWRGADIRNILDFERDFPAARVVRLEENYRSTAPILALANDVIEENEARRGKTLRTTRPVARRSCCWSPPTIATRPRRSPRPSGVARVARQPLPTAPCSTARTRRAVRWKRQMRRAQIPYRLVGAVRFYDRREIRDLVSWLRLVANPADDEAFRRAITAPKRGVGETTVELLAPRRSRRASRCSSRRVASSPCPACDRPPARPCSRWSRSPTASAPWPLTPAWISSCSNSWPPPATTLRCAPRVPRGSNDSTTCANS
jgi:DNA helicase II / ATP-dependent DNA helicase PcrA